MTTTAPPVDLTIEDGIARLVLNRPDAANSLTPDLAAAFRDQAAVLAVDASVRVVVLTAAGRAFCVGGDLGFMAEAGDDVRAQLHALASDLHEGITTLAGLDALVLASVGGMAAGAGMSLVCGADLVIASTAAKFTMAYTNASLSPDGGATWFLPRLVGPRRATELMVANPRLSAEEAAALGVVNRVVEPDELERATEEWARALASGPTLAFGAVKRLMQQGATATLGEQLQAEATSISGLAATADGREGVAAFLEKRAPRFNGAT